MEEILEKIKKSKSNVKDCIELAKKYIQNTTFLIENRWLLLLEIGEFIPNKGYYFEPEGINWKAVDLHDDFYIGKNQTYNVEQLLNTAIEDNLFESKESIIKFKESCCDKFIYSAIFDW